MFTAVVIEVEDFQEVVPVISGKITFNSFPISFQIVPEQEVNGKITK